jgi:signal transduction histidine kinase/CheY-like chemotaxis protein
MGCRGDEEFPIEISITPIRIGSLNFFSVFIRDISERKHAEAVLREGQQQAEQANLVKSQFLAMMSHEIRTPLNAVLGMQELLTHTPLNHVQSDYLKLATQSGKNLLAIVNDILDLTKVEAGKLELEQIPFDVIEITQHCVELLRLTAQAKDLSLITVIAPELNVWISGDPLRYQQVLTNLLSNAIKFTNTGSITIKLSAQSSAEDSSALLVEVIDTGLGIPLASQADLFEVFIQVDPSDTRKHGGSGLGLAISKRLVALWEGHIGVESTPNVGSRFWFTVGSEAIAPVLTITSALNKGDEAAHPAFSANILVVDDSPINQLVMAYMLRNAGYHVDLADSGSAGIAAVKKRHYDIILMDVSMPDMSGMEATTIIRQLSGAAAVVPIIAITAHALAGYQALCLAAGMNGYATKPISQKDLLAVVATWCDKTITRDAPALSALIEDSSVQSVYEPVKQAVILDQASLDALTSLLGQEAFNDLLQTYQTELTTRCDAIKQAIIQQDLIIISREAHTIKSSSANFGATALTAIAKDLEACGYNNDLPQALILAEQLLPCAAATLATMSSI